MSKYIDIINKGTVHNLKTIYEQNYVRHGRWIMHIDDLFPEESTMECDQCHEEQPLECDDNYCPNCGAKMDEVEE